MTRFARRQPDAPGWTFVERFPIRFLEQSLLLEVKEAQIRQQKGFASCSWIGYTGATHYVEYLQRGYYRCLDCSVRILNIMEIVSCRKSRFRVSGMWPCLDRVFLGTMVNTHGRRHLRSIDEDITMRQERPVRCIEWTNGLLLDTKPYTVPHYMESQRFNKVIQKHTTEEEPRERSSDKLGRSSI